MNTDDVSTTKTHPTLQDKENIIIIVGLLFLALVILIVSAASRNVETLQTALMTTFTGIASGLIGYLGAGRRNNGVATGQVDTINVNNQEKPGTEGGN